NNIGVFMSQNLPVLLGKPTLENFPATVDEEISFLSQARGLLDAGFPDHALLDIWNASIHNLRLVRPETCRHFLW
ncbi:MAG: hypothetical protein ACRDAL_06410, partial [Plesiomonas shigelloides]